MSNESLSHKLCQVEGSNTHLFLDDPILIQLQNRLGYQFQSPELLLEALTHKSFAHEKGLPNNEVLEFLGDAVLDLAITQRLLQLFPSQEEGLLSKMRSAIVNKETLAEVALLIDLPSAILVGRGELQNQGHKRDSNLSNALEALFGAIFQEVGYQQTAQVIIELFAKGERDFFASGILEQVDVKGQLQELVYKKFQSTPIYHCVEVKENKQLQFHVVVEVEGRKLAEGLFLSKKKGMQEVASKALELLKQ